MKLEFIYKPTLNTKNGWVHREVNLHKDKHSADLGRLVASFKRCYEKTKINTNHSKTELKSVSTSILTKTVNINKYISDYLLLTNVNLNLVRRKKTCLNLQIQCNNV